MSQTMSLPSAAGTAAWRQHAAWLARLWRLSPLTLLLHDDEGQVDSLVKQGLLPLTARRGIDHRSARQAKQVAGAPPRRASDDAAESRSAAVPAPAGRSERTRERVVQLDVLAGSDPLARLRHRLQSFLPAAAWRDLPATPSLVQVVGAAQAHGAGRLLLVVRHLDTLLAPRNDDPITRQALCDALVSLMSAPQLGVHVLLVVNERADALLDGLRRALPQLDDHRLRVTDGMVPLQPAARPKTVSNNGDFQRSLDAMLLRVAHFEAPVRQPAAQAVPVSAGRMPESAAMPTAAPAETTGAFRPGRRVPAGMLASVGLGLALALGLTLWQQQAAQPAPAVAAAPAAVPAATSVTLASPPPSFPQAPQAPQWPQPTPTPPAPLRPPPPPAQATPPPTAAAELQTALAGTGLPWLQAQGDEDWATVVRQLGRAPGLSLMRYDELQAARRWSDAPALQVLAPLYLESVQFLVRDDSSLRWLHDMGKARVGHGPAQGARALAAGAVWRGLFRGALPAEQSDATPAGQALAALRKGQVDAVAWVGALPPGVQGLRLLALDTDHPSTARLRQQFLLAPQADAAQGLALMNFLVSSAPTSAAAQRAAARGLCSALPSLRTTGQAVWQAVQPFPPLPTGWPAAAAATDEFKLCAVSASAPGARISQQPGTTRSNS